MYYDFTVEIPECPGKIYIKNLKGTYYVNYEYDRVYNPDKKYNIPKRTTIGKVASDDSLRMYPNANFLKFFPEAEIPEERQNSNRSCCLQIGAWIVIRKIIEDYGLGTMLLKWFKPQDAGLLLDLAAYTIITEGNAAQYYPTYAYHHPLFSEKMKIYSDTKVGSFLQDITKDQQIGFLNAWNEKRDHREKIYISYDSTNKNCQSGEIDMAEYGYAKDDKSKPIVNYAIAYDRNNREPLYYEDYLGSIADVSQLQCMLEKANAFGYKNVGFILDRGYFSEPNIHYMDRNGYSFVIMVKGMAQFVSELVLEVKGTFEDSRSHSISGYHAYGTTVKRKLYPTDEKERYFHIYYSSGRNNAEREKLENTLDKIAKGLKKLKGKKNVELGKQVLRYFKPIIHKDQTFLYGMERKDVIDRELKLCGYFAIVTSEKMNAEEALKLYKGRDASEKLFRGDKSYLGNNAFRVHSNESVESKIFIEFIALIIRNKIYTSLIDEKERLGREPNYMTVPATIRELEKMELIRIAQDGYRRDHAITATQKAILKAFGIENAYLRKAINELIELLKTAE